MGQLSNAVIGRPWHRWSPYSVACVGCHGHSKPRLQIVTRFLLVYVTIFQAQDLVFSSMGISCKSRIATCENLFVNPVNLLLVFNVLGNCVVCPRFGYNFRLAGNFVVV